MKIFLGILIMVFILTACENSIKENHTSESIKDENPSENEQVVSMNFIGQTYLRKEINSFGYFTETFSFQKNGDGNYYCSWVGGIPKDIQKKYNINRPSKYHEDNGSLTWKIIDGEIHVYYTYHASDGVVSHEEKILIYSEDKNKLFSTEYDSEVFSCVSSNKSEIDDENSFDEEEYNRQQEQAEYESSQAYYNSKPNLESTMTFIECSCGAHDCGLIFRDINGGNHEFYQSEINNYDFECPNGLKYINKKFKIEYKPIPNEYDEFVSISIIN